MACTGERRKAWSFADKWIVSSDVGKQSPRKYLFVYRAPASCGVLVSYQVVSLDNMNSGQLFFCCLWVATATWGH